MSILAKLMGRHSGNDYRQGIALFEAGRFAEAIEHLRPASKSEAKKSGSLADFYLRQALTREGKRLLIADQPDDALTFLREAAERWPAFPDLHFWYGVALAQAGRWPDVQDAAQAALSCNPAPWPCWVNQHAPPTV
jgi:tetratricopeptide (TPR) repeat protein